MLDEFSVRSGRLMSLHPVLNPDCPIYSQLRLRGNGISPSTLAFSTEKSAIPAHPSRGVSTTA